jgi:DNA-binding winged helix-turn-helix (wHTH) protein
VRIQFAHFTLDSDSRQLVQASQAIHLSPKAFDVLCLLASRRPNAVSKTELYEHVWPGTFVVDANLAVLVGEIRRALGDDPRNARFIRTVHRFGYAFCSDVIELTGVPPPGRGQPAVKAWLVWNERVLILAEGDNLIGRDPECRVWVDVPGVSRRHARVIVTGSVATIEDLGSKNGTFIDGVAVTGVRPVDDGAALTLGPVEMLFRTWSAKTASDTVKISRKANKLPTPND